MVTFQGETSRYYALLKFTSAGLFLKSQLVAAKMSVQLQAPSFCLGTTWKKQVWLMQNPSIPSLENRYGPSALVGRLSSRGPPRLHSRASWSCRCD